jgi:hypothetical protein
MTDKPSFDPLRSRNVRSMLVSEAEGGSSSRAGLSKRIALLVSLIVAALLVSTGGVALALTGRIPFIAQPVPTATSTPTPTVTPTPTPTPTPTETQTPGIDLSAPQTWIIGDGTVGPLALGQPRADAADYMVAFTTEPYQCDVDVYSSTSSRMNVVLSSEDDGTNVAMILINSSLDPAAPSPRTAEGIGLGSTVDEILAAYPDIQRPDPQRYPTYSLPQPDGAWINFSVAVDTQTVIGITVMYTDYPPPEYCG